MLLLTEDVSTTFEAVGFSAFGFSGTFGEGDTIPFPGIISNVGGHYDVTNSVFTCPITGLYVFHASLTSQSGYFMTADIMRNSTALVTVVGDVTNLIQGSNMAVFVCDQFDTVYVESKFDQDNRMLGDSERRYNSFSGFLLYPV